MRALPRLLLSVTVVLIGLQLPSANAQLIRINDNGFGGVNIRVPFVHVVTSPWGGTHVRAPFVNVNTPPPPYYVPYHAPPVPYRSWQPGYVVPSQPAYNPPPGTIIQPAPRPYQNLPSSDRPADSAPSAIPSTANSAVPAQPVPAQRPSEQPTGTSELKSVLERQVPSGPDREELPTPVPSTKKKDGKSK
jgi:hypothetical protein